MMKHTRVLTSPPALGALLACSMMAYARFAFAAAGDKPAGIVERDQLRNQRYCEILVVTKHGLSARAAVYNTIGLNDCPEAHWKALDANKLKTENNAHSIVMNGPRYFLMDRNALKTPGPVQNFDGLEARLVAQVEVSNATSKRKPYVENIVDRETQYVFEAGKAIYELESPEGKTYIMQSYSLEMDPHLDEAALPALARRLSLPRGWRYVVRNLTEDLTVKTSESKAHILQDDLKNTYQRLE